MSASEKKKEDWMNSKWRPMMGWMYMIVCTADFVVFPVLWTLVHTVMHTGNYTQWNPLTLQGAGLFHIAMGAVLGLAAWGRTQEKLGGANNGGIQPPAASGMPATSGFPQTSGFGAPNSFGTPAANPAPTSFGGGGFGAPAGGFGGGFDPQPSGQVVTSSRGKPAPIQPPQPEI